MRRAARAGFHGLSRDLEGWVRHMYLDNADPVGLVTAGLGNLADPISLAIAMPWKRADGTLATRAEVEQEWAVVKAHQELKSHGGRKFERFTRLHLDDADIERMVERKLDLIDRQLGALFPEWEEWPADANLFGLSWAWAVGAAARYPKMIALLRAGDFLGATTENDINPKRGTIVTRNFRNDVLLKNAAAVVARGLDPEKLYYPLELSLMPPRPEPPAAEADGGASRRSALTDSIVDAVRSLVTRRNS